MRFRHFRCFAALVVFASLSSAPAALAFDEALELERLEDVPGDRSATDEDNALEVGSASDSAPSKATKPATASSTPASTGDGAAPRQPATPPASRPASPTGPSGDSVADAPTARPEPYAEPAPARANGPEIYYDEFGERKKRRRSAADYASPLIGGFDLQFGFPLFGSYVIEGLGTPLTNSSTSVRVAFEWIPITAIGKLGIGGSLGYFGTSGFSIGPTATVDVYGIPLEAFATYRFDYWSHQALVPYVTAGFQYNLVRQTTSSTVAENTNFTGAAGYFVSAGLAISLRPLSRSDAVRLDYTYGINDTYLVVEYTMATMLDRNTAPDLTVSAFRGGLRFEF
jgi:hypothetical protein